MTEMPSPLLVHCCTCRMLEASMTKVPWHMAIFDEAHTLKNDKTKTYQALDHLPSRLRYGLTGTPMANDYTELWWVGFVQRKVLSVGGWGFVQRKCFLLVGGDLYQKRLC